MNNLSRTIQDRDSLSKLRNSLPEYRKMDEKDTPLPNIPGPISKGKFLAELAIKMDQNNKGEDPMKEEVIYFDGMHKRVKQWKTLTAWAYHPLTRSLLRFATMECKGETTESVTLFWNLFNMILQEVKNDEEYKFIPKAFITDDAGENLNGIDAAFG